MAQDVLVAGQALYPHPNAAQGQREMLVSNNYAFRLLMQKDGNLVLYNQEGLNLFAHPLWHTHSAGRAISRCLMQADGNFVLYAASGASLWHAGTVGHPGAYLLLQDDGNLVVYAPGQHPLWASNTVTKPGYGQIQIS